MTSDDPGFAFTFVTREQGDQLTNIEMRVNRQLELYVIEGFEAYRPGPARKHVEQEDASRGYFVA